RGEGRHPRARRLLGPRRQDAPRRGLRAPRRHRARARGLRHPRRSAHDGARPARRGRRRGARGHRPRSGGGPRPAADRGRRGRRHADRDRPRAGRGPRGRCRGRGGGEPMSTATGLALTLLLLLLNAFFVGAEFALISARRSVIEPKALEGRWAAKITIAAMEQVSLMMAGAQMGITVCSLALGAISEPAIAHLIAGPLELLGVPGALTHPIAFAIALSLVTYLHVVFGEMVPKNIALAGPDRMALALSPVLMGIVTVLRPVLWLLNATGNLVLRLLGITPKAEVTSAFSRNEVAAMVSESREGGLLEDNDEALLLGALRFEVRSVANLVIGLDEVSTLPEGVTAAQAEAAAVEGYSRFPVRAADSRLIGYVHIK